MTKTIVFHYIGKNIVGSITVNQFQRIVKNNPDATLRFDDGTKEHYTKAYSILKKVERVGYFFPVTSVIVEKKVLTVHKIHLLLEQHANELSKELKNVKVDENEVNKFYDYETRERARIKYALNFALSESKRCKIVNKLFNRFFDERVISNYYYMSFDELREMADNDMIIGSHTHTHPNFLGLTKDEMLREITVSKRILEQELGKSVEAFAYPLTPSKEIVKKLKPFLFDLGFKKIFSPYDEKFDAKEVPTQQSGHGTSATGAPRQNRGQS